MGVQASEPVSLSRVLSGNLLIASACVGLLGGVVCWLFVRPVSGGVDWAVLGIATVASGGVCWALGSMAVAGISRAAACDWYRERLHSMSEEEAREACFELLSLGVFDDVFSREVAELGGEVYEEGSDERRFFEKLSARELTGKVDRSKSAERLWDGDGVFLAFDDPDEGLWIDGASGAVIAVDMGEIEWDDVHESIWHGLMHETGLEPSMLDSAVETLRLSGMAE